MRISTPAGAAASPRAPRATRRQEPAARVEMLDRATPLPAALPEFRRIRLRALLLCALPWASASGAESALTIREVAPGVFVHPGQQLALDAAGHDDIANIGFIVGSRCVAVIDTGGSVRIGRALRAAIRQRTRLPICYVVNTHVHVDHVLGNAAFRQQGTEFLGHAQLPDALTRSREFFLKNYAADLDTPASAEQIVGPDRTGAAGSDLILDLGEGRLTLHA